MDKGLFFREWHDICHCFLNAWSILSIEIWQEKGMETTSILSMQFVVNDYLF